MKALDEAPMTKPLTRRITITLRGYTEFDLDLALHESVSRIQQGYLSGSGSNDSGGYYFDVSDVPEEEVPA